LVKVAERLRNITYAIRDVYTIAKEVAKTKKVHYLNIGDPGLFPDSFSTPKYIREALAKATLEGNNLYADSLGVPELRRVICEAEKASKNICLNIDDILITQGVTEGIMFLMSGLAEPGREFLVPGPGYPAYSNYITFFGGSEVYYRLDEEDEWNPDVDSIRKQITEKTQAILVSSPNNPTGGMYSEKVMGEILDLAAEHKILVISDEIYDKITYDETCVSPASIRKDVPIVGMNGFSKAHMATGWRLGYMYFYDPDHKLKELKENIEKMARIRLCANTPAQYAAIESYTHPRDHTSRLVENLRTRRDYAYKRMQELPELSVTMPKGAFYMFPKIELGTTWKNDREFVIDLLKETGVCVTYGSGFGKYGDDHFRMTFLPSVNELEQAFDKIDIFLKSRRQNK
jgi:aspartate/methionine/tyrosine aminotransferase